jgi:hypothetical protein
MEKELMEKKYRVLKNIEAMAERRAKLNSFLKVSVRCQELFGEITKPRTPDDDLWS